MFLLYFVVIYGVSPLLYFLIAKRKGVKELKPILPYVAMTFIASFYEFFGTLTFKWDSTYWFVIYEIFSFLIVLIAVPMSIFLLVLISNI